MEINTQSNNSKVQASPDTKKLWHMYGNTYDLKEFAKKHPGGTQILKTTQGHLDITPMFESYHAFADIENLKLELQKFKVGKSEHPMHYTFNKGEFYDTLRNRVKLYFGKSKNVNDKVKNNTFWFNKCLIFAIMFIINVIYGFFVNDIGLFQSCFHSSLAGFFIMCTTYCVFHDASHFAVYQRNFGKNDVLAKIVGALILWNSDMWMMHHSFRHHAYTGDEKLDPDVLNFNPLVRKTDRVDKRKYLNIPAHLAAYTTAFATCIFPGQWFGQVIIYWLEWKRKGIMWRMAYPKHLLQTKIYETLCVFFIVFMHVYKFNILVTICYVATINITYALTIIPDHDTNETHMNYNKDKKDWGETQVRNSGNFSNNQWGDIVNHFFGGINYQIEHHLFPSMCGVHLNKIAPIVQQTCKEFDIPYVSHTGVMKAYIDFLKCITYVYKH